ncbi:MAG: site-specific DNA-methyltransferase [Terriglobales bacterium]
MLAPDPSTHPFAHVKRTLGEPYYEASGVCLYRGDCLDLFPRLNDCSIDLTVTSPPYNIGKEYESLRDVTHYVDWCAAWIDHIFRATKHNGAFWLNLGYLSLPARAKAIPIPYLLWDRVPFYLIQEVVWNYGAGVAARRSFSPRNEKFLWYVKHPEDYTFNLDEIRDPDVKYPNQKKNGKLKCNPLGKNPTDVWQFPKVTSGANRSSVERTPHPAQFPIAVIDRIVKACSNVADLVLDPFIGSGTVAVTCLINKRSVLGFERESKYLDIAARRIEAWFDNERIIEAQPDLFGVEEYQL